MRVEADHRARYQQRMHVIVVGGSGYLGRLTVEALGRFPGIDVQSASRSGAIRVDVTRPETFSSLASADVLIDLTDGTRTRPDALLAWALAQGKTVIEATSDAETIRRLIETFRVSQGPGRLVLGGGIFTGVSNLLAREVTNELGPGASVSLAVSSSPYSGAGKGTIALMVDSSSRPAVYTRAGERREVSLERGPRLDFDGVQRPTLRASLAEAEMLPISTKAREVDTWFAIRPAFLVTAFVMLPAALLRAGWFRSLLEAYFVVLRSMLLRGVSTAVQLRAEAVRGETRVLRQVTARDGMRAGGWALAAMAEAVHQAPPRAGLSFIDDVVTTAQVVERVNAVADEEIFRRC